ncbi:MAG: hypothetical protein FJX75_21525 [Armatimonadetes bacterium]|nr:hypothetical protein [Armatimonadota bacterium]
MDTTCRVEMLGGLRVQRAGQVIARFSTERTGALLAYLAYYLGHAQPREVLAEVVWPGRPPRSGRGSLNTALWSLRRQLEPPGLPRGAMLQGDRFAVQLNPSAVTTDVGGFEAALLCAGAADSVAARMQHLADAVALYVGELLPGFYDGWVLAEQRKLADRYAEAAVKLSVLLSRSGDPERATEVVREAIARDPLREEVHGELMRLYAASGAPIAALRQYGELKELLAAELGQKPSAAIEQLAQEIRAGAPDLPAPRLPAKPATARQRGHRRTGTVTFLLTDIEG